MSTGPSAFLTLGAALVETESGVAFAVVFRGGPAWKAGIRRGDRLSEVGRRRIERLSDVPPRLPHQPIRLAVAHKETASVYEAIADSMEWADYRSRLIYEIVTGDHDTEGYTLRSRRAEGGKCVEDPDWFCQPYSRVVAETPSAIVVQKCCRAININTFETTDTANGTETYTAF